MQVHNEWRDLGLQLADSFDTMVAHGARARLHAQAAFARLCTARSRSSSSRGPATPHRVLEDGPLARLLHYPSGKAGAGKPILIVASLINRYYVLDLLPELSVIALLNRRGFDVYVLDWKSPGAAGPETRLRRLRRRRHSCRRQARRLAPRRRAAGGDRLLHGRHAVGHVRRPPRRQAARALPPRHARRVPPLRRAVRA